MTFMMMYFEHNNSTNLCYPEFEYFVVMKKEICVQNCVLTASRNSQG